MAEKNEALNCYVVCRYSQTQKSDSSAVLILNYFSVLPLIKSASLILRSFKALFKFPTLWKICGASILPSTVLVKKNKALWKIGQQAFSWDVDIVVRVCLFVFYISCQKQISLTSYRRTTVVNSFLRTVLTDSTLILMFIVKREYTFF